MLGYIVDVNTAGLMLVSEEPVALAQDFDLTIEASRGEEITMKINFKAHSLWGRKDADKECYNTGMSLIDPSPEDIGKLRNYIAELTF